MTKILSFIQFAYNSILNFIVFAFGIFLLVYTPLKSFNLVERPMLWTVIITTVIILLIIDYYLPVKFKAVPRIKGSISTFIVRAKELIAEYEHINSFFKKNFIIIVALLVGLLIFNTCFRYKYMKTEDWKYFYKIDMLLGKVSVIEIN